MVALFGAASFLGAALLFLVEPMLAKLVLPYFGGSPMVWNTCTLMFQVLLLVGYLYVHASTGRLGPRRHPWLHLTLLVLPVLALPVALPGDTEPPPGADPTLWLIRVLLLAAGLPFALLATTGPLLQRWFSWSGHARADDPYFLYAASNAGSVVGLLGYPFVIEPAVGLTTQTRLWSLGYLVFILLVAACGVAVALSARRRPVSLGARLRPVAPSTGRDPVWVAATDEGVSFARRLAWVGLAFLPSSLMLGVTTHVSTDIAAIPMFWTVPLAVYLATFVVAFGRPARQPRLEATIAAVLAIAVLLMLGLRRNPPVWFSVSADICTLAAVGLAAHGRLAASRPQAHRLTGFYLLVSLGGALGGVLNGLVAPLLLDRPVEYPLALSLVPLLLLGMHRPLVGRRVAREPLVWATCLLLVAAMASSFLQRGVLFRDRTFYGSYRVTGSAKTHLLIHGTTLHGWEVLQGPDAGQPTSYYSRSGPIGDVMAAYGGQASLDRVAVVGMGVGTLAAYGRPGQRMDFYEIDPAVVRIARDSGYFHYLGRSRADVRVVVGDGRLSLARAPDASYGLIVLDAFSSDAIPAHLLTEEAIAGYRRKLSPGGILAIHVTNRHLRLAPVLAAQARHLGMSGLQRIDSQPSELASRSHWVVLARDEADLDPLRGRAGWGPLDAGSVRAWTDDYSSLVQVLDVGLP